MNNKSRIPRLRRAGFILFFGSRQRVANDPARDFTGECPNCHNIGPIKGKGARTWFTLFFLPVFPMAAANQFYECFHCRFRFQGNVAVLQRQAQDPQDPPADHQSAIAMYNQLREKPADGDLLDRLMNSYINLHEYRDAIAAARDYPQALEASEPALLTLARAHLGYKEPGLAIDVLQRVLARNPGSAPAFFLLGHAYMALQPPHLEYAKQSAEGAFRLGMPEAGNLLREILNQQTQPQDSPARESTV